MVLAGGYGIGLILAGAGVACLLAGLWMRRGENLAKTVELRGLLGGRTRRRVRLRLAPPPRVARRDPGAAAIGGQALPALRRAYPDPRPA